MGLDSLVPFVYLVWLGVLRLGLNEVVHVHLPKYPYINNTKTPPFHTFLTLCSRRSRAQEEEDAAVVSLSAAAHDR
ncbi:hypothetical protein Scep_001838 [Stephania cephalantha]|uniref:Secreted protein n=1 Tax=Stephania cephalantha TaxID=152367 RepID=A0AAP0L8S4_9MAGN